MVLRLINSVKFVKPELFPRGEESSVWVYRENRVFNFRRVVVRAIEYDSIWRTPTNNRLESPTTCLNG